ncbi:MAG: hypothetical protein LC799_23065 [Actinobacteria bacterium]|jgi:biotin-(acetyl-CoA carboxylase) ligase|nr:hypothetical protein [Actinomycetota bacterium]HYZ08023.1 hypothetical protein [Pseudonocardiaceae bacterium]
MSTRDETYRGMTTARMPDNETTRVIVTRQGLGRNGRVWLTTGATMLSTVVLTDDEAEQLIALVAAARDARSADPAR